MSRPEGNLLDHSRLHLDEGYRHAIRIPANEALPAEIEPLLIRPVGRPIDRSSHTDGNCQQQESCQ